MSEGYYHNSYGSPYPQGTPGFFDQARNPYEQGFRTPIGCPPVPRHSSSGPSPRHWVQQNQSFRQNKPYTPPGDRGQQPFQRNRPQYQSNDGFQNSPRTPNQRARFSPSSGGSGFSSYSPSPNGVSPSFGDTSGVANRQHFTPKNAFHGGRRHSQFSNDEFNPGGSSNIKDYYSPSMFIDPWKDLVPVEASHVTPEDSSYYSNSMLVDPWNDC